MNEAAYFVSGSIILPDCVDQPHTVLFAVTNQRLSNFAVSPISKHIYRRHITTSGLG